MKIVFLVSSLSAGGAERIAATLCNAWAARGDSVTLIPTYSGGGTSFYSLDSRIELVYLANVVQGSGRNLFGYMRRLMALREIIRSRNPDVVVSFLSNVNVAAIIAMVGLKTSLVVCERTDPSVAPISKTLFLTTQLLYRFSDALVVQTHDVAAKAVNLFPKVRRIITIANPVAEDLLLLSRNQHSAERKILLSLGRIADEKQVDLIIEAFLKVQGKFYEWDLHIYGDGSEKAKLEKMIQKSGMTNRIFLKGNTKSPSSVMLSADVFVMASKFEGFPNTLLEAMAIGLPCVSFDCPSGPREISNDGEYARLVPPGDVAGLALVLAELFDNEPLRLELGQKARQSIQQRYMLATVLAQWDKLFRDVGVLHVRR